MRDDGPRGHLLRDKELADALGVPLPIARALVKHQRLDGDVTDDGHVSAREVEVQAFLQANPAEG